MKTLVKTKCHCHPVDISNPLLAVAVSELNTLIPKPIPSVPLTRAGQRKVRQRTKARRGKAMSAQQDMGKGVRGLLTPGVGARVGSHRAPRSRALDRIATFFRPRPEPGCSYLKPAMERDRGAQRVNSFNHCCYARARGMVRKERVCRWLEIVLGGTAASHTCRCGGR
jgi:hypothetical protein